MTSPSKMDVTTIQAVVGIGTVLLSAGAGYGSATQRVKYTEERMDRVEQHKDEVIDRLARIETKLERILTNGGK